MLLIITYHHVGQEDAWPLGGIYPVSPQRIREQVRQLGQAFEFIGQAELKEALAGGKDLPRRSCLITFDDGLALQYQQALPVLEEMGVPAVFFLCGQPWGESRVLDVHKLQWCLANIPAGEFMHTLEEHCQGRRGRPLGEMMVEPPEGSYRRDTPERRAIKYNFNYHFDDKLRAELLEAVFASRVEDEAAFARDWYMDRAAVRHVAELGYLGLHTYGHNPLGGRTGQEIVADLAANLRVLEETVGRPLGTLGLSYPYGGAVSLSREAAQAAARAGVCYGMTTQPGFNWDLKSPMWLYRMDTNDAPGGKTPTFSQHDLPEGPEEG